MTKVTDTFHFGNVSCAKNHTAGHQNCSACAESNNMLTVVDADFSVLTFSEVVPLWRQLRKQRPSLKQYTHAATDGYLRGLELFFGSIRLSEITAGHLREYQIARGSNRMIVDGVETHPWSRAASNSYINHELSVLGQILKHAKLWAKIRPYYNPLPVPKWSPREVLSEDEEESLFRIAAGDPEIALVYWVACITNNTTAAGCELRGLRLRHIFLREPVFDKWGNDLNPSEIYIPSDAVKNESRPRKIALNTTAKWAIEQCYQRALRLGACQPDHYLFPFRVKRNQYDPTRRASKWWLRNSWNKLRAKTGFRNLNPHDLRHLCITRMLENGVDPETVRAIAGHVTDEMMHYYSHIRRQAKYAAVMAIDPRAKKPVQSVRPLSLQRFAVMHGNQQS